MQDFPTLLPIVAAALIDAKGRCLMQRRRVEGEHGGLWEFPGGKVEPGETPKIALVRELAEELGIEVAQDELAPAIFSSAESEPSAGGKQPLLLLYLCRRWNGAPKCLDADRIEWFSMPEIASLPMPPLDVPLAAWLAKAI